MPHLPEQPTPTTVAAELGSMKRIVATLEALDPAARARVLDWFVDRYGSDDEAASRDGYWPQPADGEDVTR